MSGDSNPMTRICVLSDEYLRDWQVDALERAVNVTNAELSLVVVNEPPTSEIDPDTAAEAVNDRVSLSTIRLFLQVLSRERAWALVIAERKLAEELGLADPPSKRVMVDDVDVFDGVDVKRVPPLEDDHWTELQYGVVERIRDESDVAIRFGFGLIRGDVLTAPTHGVLSFHPADIRRYRGLGPPKAFLDDRRKVGVTLQRLSEDIDAGTIVAFDEVDVSDCGTLWSIYERVNEVQSDLLAEGVANLSNPAFTPTEVGALGPYYSTKNRRRPGFALRVLSKNIYGRISSQG
jgi:folate-dependent phosphoribosylglycinamide formyltransferase PurN